MIENLKNELEQIKLRNSEVELNKAWEISYTRRISLVMLTYIVIGIYMSVIELSNPWQNALIPTVGYFLSTLTLRILKKIWIKYKY